MIKKVYLSSNNFYDKIPSGVEVSSLKIDRYKEFKYTYCINISSEDIKWNIFASISSDSYIGVLKRDVLNFSVSTSL